MSVLENLLEIGLNVLLTIAPAAATTLAVVMGLALIARVLRPNDPSDDDGSGLLRQLAMLAFTGVGIVLIILSLPVSDAMRGQMLSLLGLLVSGAIALSSTTFVGNMLAGMMLRALRNFRTGDFVQVGEQFGRVSERGLLHVEIQTVDRDLLTLPNLHLVTNPVKVVRASGTFISAEVSLGYDIPHTRIEACMLEAVENAGLSEGFVQILELGDFSVTYRVSGFLEEVRTLITARSRLRRALLDALHGGGIEIVSPTFMNQRVFDPRAEFIPPVAKPDAEAALQAEPEGAAERAIFDKADAAEERDRLRARQAQLETQIEEVSEPWERARLKTEHVRNEARLAEIETLISADRAESKPEPS